MLLLEIGRLAFQQKRPYSEQNRQLRSVFWRQFWATEVLRTVFWTSCSFLTKVANFEQKDSCAECFDANFEQQDKCARGFRQVLAIGVKTFCANVVVLEIGDFC